MELLRLSLANSRIVLAPLVLQAPVGFFVAPTWIYCTEDNSTVKAQSWLDRNFIVRTIAGWERNVVARRKTPQSGLKKD
jgi:hypothetical protein